MFAACELHAGAELAPRAPAERERVRRVCDSLHVAYPDERFPGTYATLLSALARGGRLVATMDLLIATAAIVESAPLVTRNAKDFSRIPGLEVLSY